MHYALFYRFVKDSKTAKQPFRSEHLGYAWEASARGELILGGALADPEDEALLLFTGDSPEVAENFARKDPYVLNGVVTQWQVRPWTTVVGKTAATPVQPD
ncbi:hypothetical protein F506_07660 [Herbaspirillum hiltneri N3]|uniref:YCII-related domain-containing protein n=1 Tax=Herbaspirillum hiltneri N3 TaxID=1262470 RepID=A0ABM5UZ82_9BURK|nr:YciI-like protein [Herbaspirillum hiltneri]AKZ62570.1 hypothetical protein F506_07660 [Herbaspirillum hiltneri N3]